MFKKKVKEKETVVENNDQELRFREWFNLKGIRSEIKNVHWLTKKELFNNRKYFIFIKYFSNDFYEKLL